MRRAQTSLGGVFLLIIGLTLIILFLNKEYLPLNLEAQTYLRQYNQRLLLNTLNYKNAEGVSVKEILAIRACGMNFTQDLNGFIKEMLKPGRNYILKAGDLTYYSQEETIFLEEINPAIITLNSYCGKNVTIIMGAY